MKTAMDAVFDRQIILQSGKRLFDFRTSDFPLSLFPKPWKADSKTVCTSMGRIDEFNWKFIFLSNQSFSPPHVQRVRGVSRKVNIRDSKEDERNIILRSPAGRESMGSDIIQAVIHSETLFFTRAQLLELFLNITKHAPDISTPIVWYRQWSET